MFGISRSEFETRTKSILSKLQDHDVESHDRIKDLEARLDEQDKINRLIETEVAEVRKDIERFTSIAKRMGTVIAAVVASGQVPISQILKMFSAN